MSESRRPEIRILIVDDHAILREGLRLLIENHPHLKVVANASNRVETLAAVQRERPDLVLLDLDLGGENALDFLGELTDLDTKARVVILTGVRDPEMHRQAIRLGAMGVVMKEHATAVLIKAIEKVHAGEAWLDRSTVASVLSEFRRNEGRRPPDRERCKIETLTEREREIISLVAQGFTTSQMTERLFISEKTVRNHLTSIYSKLEVCDRLELALYAMRHKLAPPPASTR